MDATMTQIPNNTSVIDTTSMSSVGISSTETPPPGYMSEDGDPMDQNDNLSECIVGDRTILDISLLCLIYLTHTHTLTYKSHAKFNSLFSLRLNFSFNYKFKSIIFSLIPP
jgi:hypothetical protein